MARFRLLGRYMNGTKVEAYETLDIKTGTARKLSRDQIIFLVGKGEVEGIRGRLYQDMVIIEAADGYVNISELPTKDVNTGAFKNVPTGNRRVEVDFDTAALIGQIVDSKEKMYVVQTGIGPKIVDKETLVRNIKAGKVINVRIQDYTKDGVTQHILRMSDGSKLSDLPKYRKADIK